DPDFWPILTHPLPVEYTPMDFPDTQYLPQRLLGYPPHWFTHCVHCRPPRGIPHLVHALRVAPPLAARSVRPP
ncbi:MAG: hypothetical protein Q4F07_03835, partial [Bacteroidales bacterium]|nr:hypothetical protein [Bacteroidales bacterium]